MSAFRRKGAALAHPPGKVVALAGLMAGAAVGLCGCSLFIDLEGAQCRTSTDCAVLGFSDRACIRGMCRRAEDDTSTAGGPSDGTPGDASTAPGTVPSSASDAGRNGPETDASVTEPPDVGIRLLSSVPASGAVDVDPATHLELVFEVPVAPLDGELSLLRLADDYVVESMSISDPRVVFSEQEVVVDFHAMLAGDTDYYVRISNAAVRGPQGSVFFGLTDSSALRFRTGAVTPPGAVAGGLRLWLDADHAASFKTESGAVAIWGDRSGEGNVLQQAEGGAQPVVAEAALNARRTVSFNGGAAYLVAARGLSLTSWDVFVVWRSSLTGAASGDRVVSSNGEQWILRHGGATSDSARSITRITSGETATLQLGERAANTPHIWNFTYNDAQHSLSTRTNGSGPASRAGLSASGGAPSSVFSLGGAPDGSQLFTGELAEVIVYDRMLSEVERESVLSYLATRWGVTRTACDAGEVLGPNDLCYVFDATTRTWSNARLSCQQRGSGWDFVAVGSELENRFVTTLAAGAQVWLGGLDDQPQPEQFIWIRDQTAFWNGSSSGSAVNGRYVSWSAGEPNGGGDQADCARLLDTGFWADSTCTATTFGSICQGPGG